MSINVNINLPGVTIGVNLGNGASPPPGGSGNNQASGGYMAKFSFQDIVSAFAGGSLNTMATKPINEARFKQFCDLLGITVENARSNKYSTNQVRRMYYANQLSLDWNKYSIADLEYRYWKANGQYTSGSINDMIRHTYSFWGTGSY